MLNMRLSITFNDENRRQILFTGIMVILVLSGLFTYMVSLFAFKSPSPELRWNALVTSINKPTFQKGETVTITGLLEEGTEYFQKGYYYYFTSPENIVWIVNVLDPNNMPVHFEYLEVANAQGDININDIDFTLSTTALTGTYKIRVMVWNSWLPDGETRTYIINEAEFEVI